MKKTAPYHEHLIEDLRNPKEAEAYLNAALEAGDKAALLLAIGNIIEALNSFSHAAKRTGIHRVSLHKMLSGRGNPRTNNLIKLLLLAGIRFKFDPRKADPKALEKALSKKAA